MASLRDRRAVLRPTLQVSTPKLPRSSLLFPYTLLAHRWQSACTLQCDRCNVHVPVHCNVHILLCVLVAADLQWITTQDCLPVFLTIISSFIVITAHAHTPWSSGSMMSIGTHYLNPGQMQGMIRLCTCQMMEESYSVSYTPDLCWSQAR